jgi:ATP-dependent Lhr-like helicase
VRDWLAGAFAAPTQAQEQAWPAIATGEHVLISAPTGSGKTLAAFLWALDRLTSDPAPQGRAQRRTRLVYVSPLKALSYDIERNLRAPLRGIEAGLGHAPDLPPRVSVALRTGDTPQAERARMLRHPPDILITTPESLYLMLTSRARAILRGVEWAIVDEIHAVAATKRGAHLALTLERLDALTGRDVQRIGLSATQRPLEEVARFMVGPTRKCRIVDTGIRKPLDLQIHVPVESMAEPGVGGVQIPPLDPLAGGESTQRSIWPAMYPELLRLIREHRSTIVFVNNRRSAERLALRLNELAENEPRPDPGGDRIPSLVLGNEKEEEGDGPRAAVPGEVVRATGTDAAPPREIARAHHGSLAREERLVVEEQLKAGTIPCIVATSSLELGIDMGAVDLVIQVESPKSVAAGLQRIGRAGHNVGDVSRGRIFPKFRADLLECAVLVRRMREGEIEPTVVPRNPLDVLAQQIVAMTAAEDGDEGRNGGERGGGLPADGRKGNGDGNEDVDRDGNGDERDAGLSVDELFARVTRTHTYADLSRAQLENVLDMLDGRWAGGSSLNFAELRPRIVWDRLGGVIRPRKAARALAVANAGTIPDRGLYLVTLPDGRRVGELDEEMVYEARPGQVFLLGASSWRIEEIGRDRVIVTPAPGVPGAIPFWKGDGLGRPKELGEAIGAFARWAVNQEPEVLERDYDLDRRAAVNLIELLREQQAATGVVPSDRTIVIERFRDEIGDWRLCVLSPYGGRIHAAWGLALTARIRQELGLEADAIASDDGIVLHLPDVDWEGTAPRLVDREGTAPRLAGEGRHADDWRGDGRSGEGGGGAMGGEVPSVLDLILIDPEELEDLIVGELSSSALFGARFRENAARALLIPRAYPGRRTPLWQQRLKAQTLLEVAKRYGDFPIVLETYRECLRDVLDVTGLRTLLSRLHTRELGVVEVQTPTASPLASSLLFDYVATYMYEGDTPNAERRAAALSLDRDLLRELLGQEELRDLIDANAMTALEDDLQHRSPRTRAATQDELHDVLRRVGDLTIEEVSERVHEGVDALGLLGGLEGERRAVVVRIAGEVRWIDAADAGLYRDALGVVAPGGLPAAFLADVPHALLALMRRYARTHAPFATAWARARYGLDPGLALAELERTGDVVRGELRPGGTTGEREWCDVEVLRRLRRASLAVLRKEIEPADQRALAAFLPAWQGVDRYGGGLTAGGGAIGSGGAVGSGGGIGSGGAVGNGGAIGKRAALAGSAPRPLTTQIPSATGIDRLREQLIPLQGLALTPDTWERDVLPRRLGGYSPAWLDALCASGEIVWLGAGSLGRTTGRVALYFREDLALLAPEAPAQGRGEAPAQGKAAAAQGRGEVAAQGKAAAAQKMGEAPSGSPHATPEHDALRARLHAGSCFFADLLADLHLPPDILQEALWDLVWAGHVTNDAFAPLRAPRLTLARAPRRTSQPVRHPRRFSTRRSATASPRAHPPGRWSLTAPLLASRPDPAARARALAELLLERHGILTRELVLAENLPGGFAALYPHLAELETLGLARRGYFVEGLGGAQFALPGAIERLRACRVPAAGSSPQGAQPSPQGAQPSPEGPPPLVLAATDPAQPYGASLPWPARPALAPPRGNNPSQPSPAPTRATRRPARAAGAYVVLADALPVLYLERGGRALQVLLAADDPRVMSALHALADHARAGHLRRIALEKVDGQAILGSPWEGILAAVGFHAGTRRLTLSA